MREHARNPLLLDAGLWFAFHLDCNLSRMLHFRPFRRVAVISPESLGPLFYNIKQLDARSIVFCLPAL